MAKVKFLIRLFLRDLQSHLKDYDWSNFSLEEKDLIRNLDENGLIASRGLLDPQKVSILMTEIEALLVEKSTKLWMDKVHSDCRIYGANKKSAAIENYFTNHFINKILNAYQKSLVKSGFTMAAKMVYKPNNPGSGDGWHRDNCEVKQSKSIVYLTNVDSANGPFQYIKHSHRFFYIVRDWLRYGIDPSNSRIANEKIDKLISREPGRFVEVTGNAGDVLLADTRGIHRGKPIEKDVRVAMTNYFWFNAKVPEHMANLLQE